MGELMNLSTRTATVADILQPSEKGLNLAYEVLIIIAGSLLVALCAQVYIDLPIVPITGQTFGVLLLGALLGARRGFLCLSLYAVEGLMGLPVFAGAAAGPAVLLGPTGGYIVGFIFAATAVGYLAERGWDRNVLTAFAAFLIGTLVIYLFGVPRLAMVLQVDMIQAIQWGVVPFIAGAFIKIFLAMTLLPAGWTLFGKKS